MSVPDSETLTPDDIFEILSNHRRRMVLYYLRKDGGSVEVRELAEEIAAMENDTSVTELTSQQRKRVYVSLYQTHLPKMDQMNAIEYDKDAGTVQLTDQTTNIDRYLNTSEQTTYPWTFHYVVLGLLSGLTVTLSLLSVPVFSGIPLVWLGLGIFALFAASAVIQVIKRNRETDIPFELSQYEQE
ncbi:DUF7344 domain-containing protein [Haloarcula sp. GH36]|uniref:DUF7344 domain-containing protein n=1 Tax=Haloarcula montana TaxID=3111776 RepID=UPI002D798C94|nr:hypothetical protein [Haloarcula sp. GH36]